MDGETAFAVNENSAEDSPLLPRPPDHEIEPRNLDDRPFPKLQITILFLFQMSEAVAYSVILPFVNQLVNETGITHGDFGNVGYYVGLIVGHPFF